MWEYNNLEELYHYGVPGMRWGHRRGSLKSRMEFRSYKRKQAKQAKQAAKEKAYNKKEKAYNDKVKFVDKGVKKYGKRTFKAANIGAMGMSAALGVYVTKNTIKGTKWAMGKINDSNLSTKAKIGAKIATGVLGAGLTTASIKGHAAQFKNARQNVKLANDYEYRQYMKKQNKKK